MKTLFSRILLAQVVAVVLALTVVTLITRASLNQGFKQFLDRPAGKSRPVATHLAHHAGQCGRPPSGSAAGPPR